MWGDDAYMGVTLPSRMILAGLDTPDYKCKCSRSLCVFFQGSKKRLHSAQLCATQSRLSVLHLKDSADGLFWHGVDAKAGRHSCCKWGKPHDHTAGIPGRCS